METAQFTYYLIYEHRNQISRTFLGRHLHCGYLNVKTKKNNSYIFLRSYQSNLFFKIINIEYQFVSNVVSTEYLIELFNSPRITGCLCLPNYLFQYIMVIKKIKLYETLNKYNRYSTIVVT